MRRTICRVPSLLSRSSPSRLRRPFSTGGSLSPPRSFAFGKAACGLFTAAWFASHDAEDLWWSEELLLQEGAEPCALCAYMRSAKRAIVLLSAGSFESIAQHVIDTTDAIRQERSLQLALAEPTSELVFSLHDI